MANADWLEVALVVDGELAEAVAEVLARYAPNGVIIESTAIGALNHDNDSPNGESFGYAVGPLRVCGYLPMGTKLFETRRKLEESLWHLGQIMPLPAPTYKTIPDTDWMQAWKDHYHPILIGKELLILPAWQDLPQSKRIPIRINPGMAFGTGTHPTTQLCLLILETLVNPGISMIDIGCGSGILSIAASKLGAGKVLGVDVDPTAIAIASKNAAANLVVGRILLEVGSVPEVRKGDFIIKQAPLVVANILSHVLVRLLDEGLEDLVSKGGNLVLSGILEEGQTPVLDALQNHHLKVVDRRQIEDWVAFVVTRA